MAKPDSIIARVYSHMCARTWWTLAELRLELQREGYAALDTTVSARVRDLRKPPWSRSVMSRAREGATHTVEYALLTLATETQPVFTDCRNCGTADHRSYCCPCVCHVDKGVPRG